MSKVGRKIKLSEEKVDEIIYLFKTENALSGKIKYGDIYQFANKLVDQGRLDKNTSDSFWRKSGRLGRKKVDEANQIFAHELNKSTVQQIPNITNIINRDYKNKEDLLNSLLPIEKQLQKSLETQNNLKHKNNLYQEEITKYKDKVLKLNKEKSEQQQLLFELFYYILSEANESTKSLAKKAMKEIFNDPLCFYPNIKEEETTSLKENKILSINNKNNENKLSNKFKERFK
ncbi:hypothetical protein [Bacillus sp. 2205SS5-2]|uniref:hypothetical protein n=1 Tax=Bacillus sp. 2205SS5-2 TaxID=3109031 RepID=UPI0030059D42